MPVIDYGTIIGAGFQLAAKLVEIGIEYIGATEARKAELLAQADDEYAKCRVAIAGLDAAINQNNADADQKAAEKFGP